MEKLFPELTSPKSWDIPMKRLEPAIRCLVLLKDLEKELEQANEWVDAREEVRELIGEIEEELTLVARDGKDRDCLDELLRMAALIIRLIFIDS